MLLLHFKASYKTRVHEIFKQLETGADVTIPPLAADLSLPPTPASRSIPQGK